MKSVVISKSETQLVLDFEPGLLERYSSARDCCATGVYKRGLGKTAIDLDIAPSNLSVQLSDDPSRHFALDSFERYLEKTGDMTPLYFLVEKFLGAKRNQKNAAADRIRELAQELMSLLRQAGIE
jgi:hypothetical protein